MATIIFEDTSCVDLMQSTLPRKDLCYALKCVGFNTYKLDDLVYIEDLRNRVDNIASIRRAYENFIRVEVEFRIYNTEPERSNLSNRITHGNNIL